MGVRRLGVAIFAALALIIAVPAAACAATYTVGATADITPTACPSATATDCSLRQLVLYVEAHPSPPDTIDVPAGSYVLDSAYGEIALTTNMTIVGAGANATTIEAPTPTDRSTSGDRVFAVAAPSSGPAPTVALDAMTISGGSANANNTDGAYFGGDILNSATLTLNDDWVTDGFACSGGGVSNTGGTLTIERSLISDNHAACAGGGDDSGGVQNYGEPGTPDLPGHLIIDNSTIANNDEQADGGNAARAGGAGGLAVATGSASVQNTILADNTSVAGATNCSTGVTSLGHNLEDANTCALTGTGDLPNTAPQLGPLQNNGGPTATLALPAGSPALGQVPPASCSATDQRGVARPTAGNCDIGAYELTPASSTATTPPTPSTTTSAPPPASGSTTTSAPTPTSGSASFSVGSQTPGSVGLTASSSAPSGTSVATYDWTLPGNGRIACPAAEPHLSLSSSAPVSEAVTLQAVDANGATASTTNMVSISSRLNAQRRTQLSAKRGGELSAERGGQLRAAPAMAGVCSGTNPPSVPPLKSVGKKGAAPPHGVPTSNFPSATCTQDLDFGAVDVHGCLAPVPDPENLPGGVTKELGAALCSSTGLIVCLPQMLDIIGAGGTVSASSNASLESGGTNALEAAGLPSYYTYSTISLNGLNIQPENGAPLLVVPSMDAIASSSVELFLDGVEVSPGAIPLSAYLPASGGLLANLTLANNIPIIGSLLPLTGAMSIDLYPPGSRLSDGTVCAYACSALHVNAALPDEFTGGDGNLLTASGIIEADAITGINLSSLQVSVPSAEFAGIGVSNVLFQYAAADDGFYARATLDLFPAVGSITATIDFTQGGFRSASIDWDAAPGPGIDLGGPIPLFLTHLGGGINLHPTIISANATIAGGPDVFGCSLMSLSGQTAMRFSPFGFSLGAQGSLFCQNVADMYLTYGSGYFSFGGEVHLTEPWLPFELRADVNVGVDANDGHWQFDGDVDACLDLDGWEPFCGGAEAVISDEGIGVCADLGFVHAGGGIVWHPRHLVLYFDSCDIDRFRSIHHFTRGQFRLADDPHVVAPPPTFTVPSGRRVELVGIVGEGGAPRVRLIGPGGRTITTPAGGYIKTANDVVVADQKLTHTTYIFINHPAAGTWTVQPDPGSVEITAIHGAAALPSPDVQGRLASASGGRERLRYRLNPIPHQTVTFEERSGKDGYDIVGHARGAHGMLTFAPSLQMARSRTLVAVITQDGHVREQVTLAHFHAALPPTLAAPRLHARRTNTSVRVSWQAVPGASTYLVTITAGRHVVRHALSRTTAATVAGLAINAKLTVTVTARRSSPWANAPGRAATVQLGGEKVAKHHFSLVRAT